MAEIGLKPCPFCGRKVTIGEIDIFGDGSSRIRVNCTCGATVVLESDDIQTKAGNTALRKWNERTEVA